MKIIISIICFFLCVAYLVWFLLSFRTPSIYESTTTTEKEASRLFPSLSITDAPINSIFRDKDSGKFYYKYRSNELTELKWKVDKNGKTNFEIKKIEPDAYKKITLAIGKKTEEIE